MQYHTNTLRVVAFNHLLLYIDLQRTEEDTDTDKHLSFSLSLSLSLLHDCLFHFLPDQASATAPSSSLSSPSRFLFPLSPMTAAATPVTVPMAPPSPFSPCSSRCAARGSAFFSTQ